MSLREEIELYTKLSGEDGSQETIATIGAYLRGYRQGKEDAEPHWIPVTERLPEKTGKYLAWAVVSFIPDHVDEPNTIKQIAIASYSTRARTWLGDNVEDVIAWMPLPEPFKGVTE